LIGTELAGTAMAGKLPTEAAFTYAQFSLPEVRAALHGVLQSDAFSNSKRCCDFLSYVVEQTLAGAQHELKERTIAVAVFGRQPSYDSHEDAIVRIKASEVRKRLGHYYDGAGRHAPIRIDLPTGGYVPVFSRSEFAHEAEVSTAFTKTVVAQNNDEGLGRADLSGGDALLSGSVVLAARSRTSRILFALAACIFIFIIAMAGLWFHVWPDKPTFLDEFWKPALQSSSPVYLVTAAAPVFVAYAPGETAAHNTRTEYVATNDQYVGQGDMLASHLITGMLQRMRHPYEVKTSNGVDVRQLAMHTVVLIGYSSTQWEAISKDLRFYIDGERAGMITDHGQDTEWYPRHLTKDLHADEDYAIVSRFFDPGTRAMIVLVSGATQYGTEGAAMLVTDADLLRNALHDRPPGWETKNLQIVLHMKVIGNSPAVPEAVATYYW
jgi:hypothetical protein